MAPRRFPALCVLTWSVFVATVAAAQEPSPSGRPLKQLTLEELLDVDVSLPLRREEPVFDAPAAISLLTAEDLRRLGAVSLPEALSTVPGLFVARFNASSWIVTTRGFASTAANKMLVMIDGRSVYSPLFSGVFWEQQDAFLLDLARIEVIRGPGASLWGSNAVNGVINVVSKRASETQGTLVTLGGGAEEQFHGGVRYGGRAGTGHYRVYGQYFLRDQAVLANGAPALDGQQYAQGGFRLDFGAPAKSFTLQGDLYRSRFEFFDRDDGESSGVNMLARWTRRPSAESELNLQVYYDHTSRLVPLQLDEQRDTFDVDFDHRRQLSARQSLSVGAGVRSSSDDTTASPILFFDPDNRTTSLLTAFAQHEMRWATTFSTMAGARFERNAYTGVEVQPMVRARWTPGSGHTVWGAVSRAVRLPTRFDADLRILQNGVVVLAGDPDFASETVFAYEAGYRQMPFRTLVWSLELFHNRYDDLRTQEPTGTAPPVRLGNGLNVNVSGYKIAGSLQPQPWVRVTSSYTYLNEDLRLDADSRDLGRGMLETIDPTHQFQLSARLDLPKSVELDATARHVSALPTPGTPAYTEAGFRLGWHVSPSIELALIGRDLLHADHFEFISPSAARQTRLQRALFTRATVTF